MYRQPEGYNVSDKINQCKADLRTAILNGQHELPLFTFQKRFSFQGFRYCNEPNKRIQLNSNSIGYLTRILQIMEISLGLAKKGECITKRNLYYKLISYYKHYVQVDEDIELVAFNLKATREDLHIVSSSRCLLFGNLQMELDSNTIACSSRVITNISAFRNIGRVKTHCKNLIILQKESALYQVHQLLMRLVKQSTQEMPLWLRETIFISAKGYPDNTCRTVIQSLQREVPKLFYLGDQDIYGVDILLCYAIGYNNFTTIVHKLQWIQLEQLAKSQQMLQDYLPLSRQDKIKYKQITSKQYFKDLGQFNPQNEEEIGCKQNILKWRTKLDQIHQTNRKIQLEAFFKYLPDNWVEQVINGSASI